LIKHYFIFLNRSTGFFIYVKFSVIYYYKYKQYSFKTAVKAFKYFIFLMYYEVLCEINPLSPKLRMQASDKGLR